MKIGFIGLGAMGRPIALNLERAGHDVQAYDIRPVEGLRVLKPSAAEAVRGAAVVFTSLPGPREVEALAQEIGSAMSPGTAWFDLSTNSPDCVRRIHRTLQHIRFLDAPVSGGPKGAQSGRLALWVGGDEATFREFLPVLRQMGDQPLYVGAIGAGTVAKLAHNLATFSVQAALAEVFTLGVKAGVAPGALFRALRQGATGRRRTFDRLADFFLRGQYDPADFKLSLAHKDVSIAVDLAHKEGVPLPIGELALKEMDDAMARGWAERDCRVAMTLQQQRAGVDVHVDDETLRDALRD